MVVKKRINMKFKNYSIKLIALVIYTMGVFYIFEHVYYQPTVVFNYYSDKEKTNLINKEKMSFRQSLTSSHLWNWIS